MFISCNKISHLITFLRTAQFQCQKFAIFDRFQSVKALFWWLESILILFHDTSLFYSPDLTELSIYIANAYVDGVTFYITLNLYWFSKNHAYFERFPTFNPIISPSLHRKLHQTVSFGRLGNFTLFPIEIWNFFLVPNDGLLALCACTGFLKLIMHISTHRFGPLDKVLEHFAPFIFGYFCSVKIDGVIKKYYRLIFSCALLQV